MLAQVQQVVELAIVKNYSSFSSSFTISSKGLHLSSNFPLPSFVLLFETTKKYTEDLGLRFVSNFLELENGNCFELPLNISLGWRK